MIRVFISYVLYNISLFMLCIWLSSMYSSLIVKAMLVLIGLTILITDESI